MTPPVPANLEKRYSGYTSIQENLPKIQEYFKIDADKLRQNLLEKFPSTAEQILSNLLKGITGIGTLSLYWSQYFCGTISGKCGAIYPANIKKGLSLPWRFFRKSITPSVTFRSFFKTPDFSPGRKFLNLLVIPAFGSRLSACRRLPRPLLE